MLQANYRILSLIFLSININTTENNHIIRSVIPHYDYLLSFRNGFKLTKERSRRYPAQIITDADYADDIALLANTPAQDETLQHSLERAAGGIGLYVNAHKTEYMCFKQRGDISTLNGSSLKLEDKFTFINQDRHQHSTGKGMYSYR